MHDDSITVDGDDKPGKVRFEPFIGISPRQYMRLFKMSERKDESGNVIEWTPDDTALRYTEPVKPYKREEQDANQLLMISSDQELKAKKT